MLFRSDLHRLCNALRETGYRVCRVSYRPIHQRLVERVLGRRLDRPVRPESIAGVTCIRLNTPGGFDTECEAVVARCVKNGGTAVVYGHPHALREGNAQNERWLARFLLVVKSLKDRGLLQVCLPGQLEATA